MADSELATQTQMPQPAADAEMVQHQQQAADAECKMPPEDERIVNEIATVLNSVNLSTTTMSGIREILEKKLGLDLADKKPFVREQVDLYLQTHSYLGPLGDDNEGKTTTEDEAVPPPAAADAKPAETAAAASEHNAGKEAAEEAPDQELEQFRENIEQAIEDSTPKEKKRRGGLNKVCRLSPELQAIIGEEYLPRTQVVKLLWVYIRNHNLQDPENKRNIICDDALRELFGTDSTDMFQMNKLLSKHISSMIEEGGADDGEPKAKRPKSAGGKGKTAGFAAPSPISEPLQKFFGTGEIEIPRGEVVKRIWDYIRSNQLQDPTDKRKVLCDNKLQELFNCDSFVGFSMTKLLASHFLKT